MKEPRPSMSYRLQFKWNARTPYRPSPRSCTDVVPIQRICFPIESTSMRKARSADPVSIFEAVPIMRKNFPLVRSSLHRGALQSTIIPAFAGTLCSSTTVTLEASDEVGRTVPEGRLGSPLSPLSSSGEADRTPPASRSDSPVLNPSGVADRNAHPGLSDPPMAKSSNVSSTPVHDNERNQGHDIHACAAHLDREHTVPVTLPSESVSIARTSTKIRGVDHHFTLLLSTGNQPLPAPDPAIPANSGDLYLHQHHLNTQIWVKEASGWVIGRHAHPHPFLVDHRLHVVSPNQLHWVHKKTLVTYKGRDKKAT
ncbi:hypothetical protein PISMIDRAFT_25533 [Pisolithus microcarpus 441]|uniref:Uncharacterized protein n=1 Tax=Pisolithus microcarpus 441 TaxID=765257 RepID=A0A0C9XMH1_9AGAM|nr:hypothetical protein PISMIDRAFT_25533 [Pisolithus microcarpus 441]